MGLFDREGFTPTNPHRQSGPAIDAKWVRPLIGVIVVGLLVYGGYKLLTSTSAAGESAEGARDARLTQIAERLDDLDRRLEQLEKKPKGFKAASGPATSTPEVTVPAAKPAPPKHQLTFSRPIAAQSAPSAPANSPVKPSPASDTSQRIELVSEHAGAPAGQQEWEATSDRIGNVVGELDSQRDAIERDQARLDELAGRFARTSQPFTLEKGSDRQQVGPVWLRLQGTDPKNQRYSMRLSVEDRTVELKARALHEAIQFHAADGKLSFELVVSQIGRDNVVGRLAFPQQTASTR
jgi:hypothetical protein